MNSKVLLLLLSVFIFTTINLFCQSAGQTKTYSLDDCLKIAQDNNRDIRLANSRMGLASADITSAFGDYLPNIGVSAGYSRQLGTLNFGGKSFGDITPNWFTMDASASLILFNGFSREANYSRAKEQYDSYYLNSEFVKENVKIEIYRKYVQAILAQQILKIREENFELGKKDLERIKARYESGLIAINFVYSQEAELGNREIEIVNAQNDVKIAKATLMTIMGMNPDDEIKLSEESLPNSFSDDEISKFLLNYTNFENSVQTALKNRLDYKANESLIKSVNYSLDMSKSGYMPTLSANGGWSWGNSEFTNFSQFGRSSMGINLSIPIFENFKTNYRIESAKIQLEQAETEQFKLEQNIRISLKTAILNLEASTKQMEITQRSLVSSQKNYNFASERYKLGATGVSDYFLANNLLVNSQINRINAIYNYFLAQKEVLFSIGNIK